MPPPLYITTVPQWDASKMRQVEQDMAFLPIHETLGCLVERGAEDSWCSLGQDQAGFKSTLERWSTPVGVSLVGQFFACLALWGDSAVSTKREALHLLLFQVVSGVFRQRFWVAAFNKSKICKCGCSGRHTFDGVHSVVSWCFRALLSGRYPAADHLGQPFPTDSWRGKRAGQALKIRGACTAYYGDWAWVKQSLGLRGWPGEGKKGKLCWLCQASFYGEHNCYDFTRQASWRGTVCSMSSWWAEMIAEGKYVSGIFGIPGFTVQMCSPDFMHTVCLGILQVLMGNVMLDLFEEFGGHRRTGSMRAAFWRT